MILSGFDDEPGDWYQRLSMDAKDELERCYTLKIWALRSAI